MNNPLRSRLILIIALLISCIDVAAQLKISVNISSRPDPYLSNWAQRKDVVIVTIVNSGPSDVPAKLNCVINKDGAFLARTKPEKMAVITIPPGVSQYFGEDLVPYESMSVASGADRTALQTGMLPAGLYEFCVSLLNPSTNAVISQPVCRPFTMKSYQAPILLLPTDKAEINSGVCPMLRWSGVAPRPDYPVSYRLQVFEVLRGQTPINALRVNRPILDIADITATQLLWPPDYELPRAGQQYIWTVRATDDKGTPVGEPNGYAAPFTFTGSLEGAPDDNTGGKRSTSSGDRRSTTTTAAGDDEAGSGKKKSGGTGKTGGTSVDTTTDPNPPGMPCASCGAAVVITDSTADTQPIAVNDSLTIGKFTLKVTQVTNPSASSGAGKGEVIIPWLLTRIKVSFDNIVVNSARRVVKGIAISEVDASAPTYPTQWAISSLTGFNWVKEQTAALDQWVNANGKLVKQAANANVAVKVPIGFNNVQGFTVCISEMKFSATDAAMAVLATIPMAKLDDTLSLGLNQLSICPNGLGASARLELLQDIDIRGITSGQPTFTLVARKKTASRPGCYIMWGCDDNSDTLSLDFDVMFPRSWMTPRPDVDTTKQTMATLRGKSVNWTEWMITGQLPASTFVGTNGMGLKIDSLAFDLSDIANPPGIVFPPNYDGTTDNTFSGFYAKQIKMYMPDGWRTFADSNAAPEFTAKNLIINKNGVTGTLLAWNVVMFPAMNLNHLGASVDTVKVVLLNNSLTQAYMRGRLLLPISENAAPNAITYKALFNSADTTFNFSMVPQTGIEAKLFGGAKLNIDATSSLTMMLKKGRKKFNFALNGQVGWADKTIQVGPKKITLDLSPEFENMGISYDDSLAAPFKFDKGDWSFASPQKKLAKFPVTIEKIKFAPTSPQSPEIFRGKLSFDLIVALDSNRIGGKGTFEIIGAVEKDAPGNNFRFQPTFVDFNVSKVSVYANLPAVKMSGSLQLYNEHPTWGTGFAATLQAKFKELQFQLDAAARFGVKVDNSVRYRYWYVSAKAILPPPGIAFLPGYAFYGFGVAAWRHVNVNMAGAKPNVGAVAGASSASTDTTSGASMVPDRNIAFGFQALGVLGTTPDPSKLNCDISLYGQFNSSGGMSNIGLTGDLWIQAKLLERNNAPVKGTLVVDYNFDTRVFDLSAGVVVNKSPITGNASLNVHLEGKTGIWWVKLGDPSNRNMLTVNVLGVSLNSGSYFMFGKNITPPTGFSARTNQGLSSVHCTGYTPDAAATNGAIAGNGFAGGMDLAFSTGDRSVGLGGVLSLKYNVGGGFEYNASFLRYPDGSLCGYTGYNQWYFRANAAAWAIASCGIKVSNDVYIPGCWGGCEKTIAEVRAGLWADGGFPNPTWIKGQVHGEYSILDGVYKGDFTRNFDIGGSCYPQAETLATTAAQDVAAEQKNQMIKSITPANHAFNVALTSPVLIQFNFAPSTPFELNEMEGGASGNSITRTFQAKYMVTLEQNDSGTWKPVTTTYKKDPLGAYLYRKQKGITINTSTVSQSKGGSTFSGAKASQVGGSSGGSTSGTLGIGGMNLNFASGGSASSKVGAKTSGITSGAKLTGQNLNDGPAPPTDADNFSFDSGIDTFINNTADWSKSKTYRVTVVGTLWENVNGTWQVAKDRATNQDVKQTVVQTFNTPMDAVHASNSGMKGGLSK